MPGPTPPLTRRACRPVSKTRHRHPVRRFPPGPIRPRAAHAGLADSTLLPPPGDIDIPVLASVTQPTYGWNLDGVTMHTRRPYIEHDFGDRLDPHRPHTVFHITLTLQEPGRPVRVIRRSVSIANPYFLSRQRGIVRPPLRQCDLSVRHGDGCFRAGFSVRNPEPAALTLTSMQVELIAAEGPRTFDPRGTQPCRIVLAANAETRVDVAIPTAQVPAHATALAVHYRGTAPDGLPVRVTAYFDVPQHLGAGMQVNPAAQQMLEDLVSRGLVASATSIGMPEVLRLTERNLLPAPTTARANGARVRPLPDALANALRRPAPAHPAAHLAEPAAQALHVEPAPAVEGASCEPWNLPGQVPANMECVPTAVKKWIFLPARFMNARKGDLVLNPGDGSLVSRVLQSVSPSQAYSHSGIMTRNFDEITHSTASQARLTSAAFLGTDGFRPDALKYAWPGVITQTVEQAVNGEWLFDIDSAALYQILDFGTLEGKPDLGGDALTLAPALVIKPLDETLEIRQTLNGIADFAAQQAGKSHYRFFCYTDPRIATTDKAPASARWAANTYPTVCSSLLWHAIRQAGVPMEGGLLEQADLKEGAQIVPSTPDGLYLYQETERAAAGAMLFTKVREMVLQEAGWLGEILTDVADQSANQMLNAFAFDWCDADATNSDKWRTPGDAQAVSPANLAFYDAPLYGDMEPLLYRPARWEEVTLYEWKTQTQFGAVAGIVRDAGQPVVGARVARDATHFVTTQKDGSFLFEHVGTGPVQLEVEYGTLRGTATTTVAANQTAQVAIDLQPPAHLFRRLVIDGWMRTVDYEFAAAFDPYTIGDIYAIAQVGPASSTHVRKQFDLRCDDALGRLTLSLDLLDNDAVMVSTTLRCYHDGKGEDDYVEAQLLPFIIPAGYSYSADVHAYDGDKAYASFTISNTVDPA